MQAERRPHRVAVVGGASPVGMTIASYVLAGGATVVVMDRDETALGCSHVYVDPAHPEDALADIRRTTSDFDSSDGVVVCSDFSAVTATGLLSLLGAIGSAGSRPVRIIGTIARATDSDDDVGHDAGSEAVLAALEGEPGLAGTQCCRVVHGQLGRVFLDCRGEPIEAPLEDGETSPETVARAVMRLFAPGYLVPEQLLIPDPHPTRSWAG